MDDDREWGHSEGTIERVAQLVGVGIIVAAVAPFFVAHLITSIFLDFATGKNVQHRMNVVKYSRWVGDPSRRINN
jgi:hypothetical protein